MSEEKNIENENQDDLEQEKAQKENEVKDTKDVKKEKVEKKETKEKNEIKDSDIYIAKLNDDLETQRKKAEEYYDSLKRNMAEFDNFKKRITKEKDSMYDNVLSDVIKKLLPVIDNFEKAKDTACEDTSYKEGISMIYDQLVQLLSDYGIEKIEDLGKTFDPEFHEAVMSVEDETKGEKEIVEVLRTGYKLNDKVVRHSLVKVAN